MVRAYARASRVLRIFWRQSLVSIVRLLQNS